MYKVLIDPPALARLNSIASDVSSFFNDTKEGQSFLKEFKNNLKKIQFNPYSANNFDNEARHFDISYRGFNYYAVFIITENNKIFITDIFSKRQNIKKRYR